MLWLTIARCGAGGALARFALSGWMQQLLGREFPWATLTVNGVGSLLIGLLVGYTAQRHALPEVWRIGLITGGLGAFTTFSTFSLETVHLLQQQLVLKALAYMLLSLILCVSMAALGLLLTNYRA